MKLKKKFPLPKVPNTLESRFRSLCEPLPISACQQLRTELEKSVKAARKRAEINPRINKRRLEHIADRCSILLDAFQDLDSEKRALIVGALRYFVIDEDAFSDEAFFTGLDDDAKIVNHVLAQLDIDGSFIPLD